MEKPFQYKSIFWGIVLIITGILFFLRQYDVVSFRIESILRLWPLLLFWWGITYLPVKAQIKFYMNLLVLGLAVLLLLTHQDKSTEFYDTFTGFIS